MGPVGGLDVARLGVGRGFLQKSILSQKPKVRKLAGSR